jgi:hypothetical protein
MNPTQREIQKAIEAKSKGLTSLAVDGIDPIENFQEPTMGALKEGFKLDPTGIADAGIGLISAFSVDPVEGAQNMDQFYDQEKGRTMNTMAQGFKAGMLTGNPVVGAAGAVGAGLASVLTKGGREREALDKFDKEERERQALEAKRRKVEYFNSLNEQELDDTINITKKQLGYGS